MFPKLKHPKSSTFGIDALSRCIRMAQCHPSSQAFSQTLRCRAAATAAASVLLPLAAAVALFAAAALRAAATAADAAAVGGGHGWWRWHVIIAVRGVHS